MDYSHKPSIRLLYASTLLLAFVAPSSAQAQKIKQIVFERTPCYGTCPVYRITLNSDGSVVYNGLAHVSRLGVYRERLHAEDFVRLSSLVDKLGFFKLKDRYVYGATDMATQILTVVTDKGRKTVVEYGPSGPSELWALQTLVDVTTAGIRFGGDVNDLSRRKKAGEIDVKISRPAKRSSKL